MNTIIVKITIMLITGPFGFNKDQAINMYASVKERVRQEVGVELKLKNFRRRNDIFSALSGLPDDLRRYQSWKAWLTSRGMLKKKNLYHIIFPPMPWQGKRYIGGFASHVCGFKKFQTMSMANAQMVNQDNENRFDHSAVAMLHEVLHDLGALHIHGQPNVMHPSALAYVSQFGGFWDYPILDETKAQVRYCVENQ